MDQREEAVRLIKQAKVVGASPRGSHLKLDRPSAATLDNAAAVGELWRLTKDYNEHVGVETETDADVADAIARGCRCVRRAFQIDTADVTVKCCIEVECPEVEHRHFPHGTREFPSLEDAERFIEDTTKDFKGWMDTSQGEPFCIRLLTEDGIEITRTDGTIGSVKPLDD